MKKPIFEGVATAMYTPMKCEGKTIDYAALERLIDRQLQAKVSALVLLGTTGEAPTITDEERKSLIPFVIGRAKGKIPVIVGVGSNCTAEAAKLAAEAEKLGANAVLAVTPYYNKCNENGLLRHYAAIASATNLPIIVYNVPSRTGMDLNSATYAKLAKIKTVKAIKECNTSIEKLKRSIDLTDGEISFYCGADEALPEFILNGADGAISVTSNVIPEKIVDVYLKKRNYYETEKELVGALFCDVNPIPVKYAAEVLFGESGDLRLPLTRADKRVKEYLINTMNKLFKGDKNDECDYKRH